MKGTAEKRVVSTLYYLCLLTAFSFSLWCFMEYSKNTDISEVSYKKFDPKNQDSKYPSLSLCFLDVYKRSSFETYNDSFINSTSYSMFLRGDYWNDKMLQLSYEHVTNDLKGFIIGTCMTTSTSSECEEIGQINTGFFVGGGDIFKCISFEHNYESTLDEVMVAMNNSVFPNGVRPEVGGFLLMYHYPNQLSRSFSSVQYKWPDLSSAKRDYYAMQFYITDVEIMRRRTDGTENCYDGNNYDSMLYDHVMRSVGCQPPYWKSTLGVKPCDSKKKMSKAVKYYMANLFEDNSVPLYRQPCVEIIKIKPEYLEKAGLESKNSFNRHIYEKFEKDSGTLDNWFIINTHFWKAIHFKRFKQIKAYSVQSVIGNAGGYVGLVVGLTINEILGWLVKLFFMAKSYFSNANNINY